MYVYYEELVGLGSLSWDTVSLLHMVSSSNRLPGILQMVVKTFPGLFKGKTPVCKGFQSFCILIIFTYALLPKASHMTQLSVSVGGDHLRDKHMEGGHNKNNQIIVA